VFVYVNLNYYMLLLANPICLCLAMIVYCVTNVQMMLQVILVKHRARAGLDWGKALLEFLLFMVLNNFVNFYVTRLGYCIL